MKIILDSNIPAQTFWVDGEGNPITEPSNHLTMRRTKVESDGYTPKDGETDVSSMGNWCYYTWLRDYIYCDAEIQKLFEAKGATENQRWEASTSEEQDIAAMHFLVSKALRLERYTAEQDALNFQKHAEDSTSAREMRVNLSKANAGQNILDLDDRIDFFNSTRSDIANYVEVNDMALSDWMNLPVGQNGFEDKSYFQQGILDYFNQVVVKGEYYGN